MAKILMTHENISKHFKTVGPKWDLKKVFVFTLLNTSPQNEKVSFAYNSQLGKRNRRVLEKIFIPRQRVFWLKLVHGNKIIKIPNTKNLVADGCYATTKNVVCALTTADCLPIVFTNKQQNMIGIVHAGRKGLYKKIITKFVEKCNVPPEQLLVWIGPGIKQVNYPVSEVVRNEFIKQNILYKNAFKKHESIQYLMDLLKIAKIQLNSVGIRNENIFYSNLDTFANTLLHSARRDSDSNERIGTIAWLE